MGEGELRISRDPAHLGQYQIEIETELATDVELIEAALRSARYGVVDFDPWGRTYLSVDDPYLEVDVDALSDYGDRSRLRMRRSKISEHEVDAVKEYVQDAYHAIGQELARAAQRYGQELYV